MAYNYNEKSRANLKQGNIKNLLPGDKNPSKNTGNKNYHFRVDVIRQEANVKPIKYEKKYFSYDPKICNELVELMSTGLSLTAASGRLLLVEATVRGWADKHPELKEAIKIGKQLQQEYWENRIKENLIENKHAQSPLIKLIMAHNFGICENKQTTVDLKSSDGSMSPKKELTKEEIQKILELKGLPTNIDSK